jgi:hypothetical protein
MQEASLFRPDAGLKPDPHLVGSDEWWAAVESGQIRRVVVVGAIARVFWGSMGDWAMFTIEPGDGGDATDWTREGDYTRYAVGLAVRLTYVIERFKDTVPLARLGDASTRLVITIDLEQSDQRSPADVAGPFATR